MYSAEKKTNFHFQSAINPHTYVLQLECTPSSVYALVHDVLFSISLKFEHHIYLFINFCLFSIGKFAQNYVQFIKENVKLNNMEENAIGKPFSFTNKIVTKEEN